jgi:hypothetical protein
MKIIRNKIVTTRKKHKCNACLRMFEAGSKMITIVLVDVKEIFNFRQCTTCNELLLNFPEHFVNNENMIEEGCVNEFLERNETPEKLLNILKDGKRD